MPLEDRVASGGSGSGGFADAAPRSFDPPAAAAAAREPEPEEDQFDDEPEPEVAPEPEPEPAPAPTAAAAAPSGPRVVLTTDRIEIRESIHFAGNKADIQPDSFQILEEIAAVMQSNSHIKRIEIGGHCSDTGSDPEKDAWELELSQLRAEAVAAFLVKMGVSPDRLVAKGYGDTQPIADNSTKEGRAANRRVEFVIIKETEAETFDDDLDLGDDDLDIDPDAIADEDLLGDDDDM